jgi:predicted RNA binding protein YcfA (HicA-like mRNA interferase family)
LQTASWIAEKKVTLSAGSTQGEQILNKLEAEERLIYMQLGKIVSHWRTHIIAQETEGWLKECQEKTQLTRSHNLTCQHQKYRLVVHLRLKPYSHLQVIKALSKLGFQVFRQRGSHIVLKGFYSGIERTVVVPKHKEIAIGPLETFCFRQESRLTSFLI